MQLAWLCRLVHRWVPEVCSFAGYDNLVRIVGLNEQVGTVMKVEVVVVVGVTAIGFAKDTVASNGFATSMGASCHWRRMVGVC